MESNHGQVGATPCPADGGEQQWGCYLQLLNTEKARQRQKKDFRAELLASKTENSNPQRPALCISKSDMFHCGFKLNLQHYA